ncbi:MAG: EH signature domain-containing protein [Proteobacteria bacterium]|nr:EH signature domain-containing protein [Pseudomonadota bacterium]
MIEPAILTALRQRIDDANAPLASVVVRCQEQANRTIRNAERIVEHVGFAASKREAATASERLPLVMKAFERRAFDALSFADRRYAAKQFEHATPLQMQALLAVDPSRWETLASECFRRFEEFRGAKDYSGFVRLLKSAPADVAVLHGSHSVETMFSSDGPMRVAKSITAKDLCVARDALVALGFHPRWEYTAIALARWADAKASRAITLWDALVRDIQLQAMLLPPIKGVNRTWFSADPRPANYPLSKVAQAIFVAAIFRSNGLDRYWGELTEKLLASDFGDPRLVPISAGWKEMNASDPACYLWFLEFLVTQDLEVFFQHVMSDPRRDRFWRRYLQSIRRTVCVLDRDTHRSLTTKFGAADAALSGAMSRAKVFTTKRSGVHAFCLFFDRIVIVEFSEQGNAAYVYDRATFDRLFEGDLHVNQVANHNALKVKSSALGRVLHMGANWEDSAVGQLDALGVYLDRTR